jgi:NAD(P)H-quinone oxidoreductase subunit 5
MQTVISIPWLTGALLALMPAGLVLTALPSVHATRNAALATRQRVRWAAALALVAALAAGQPGRFRYRPSTPARAYL